MTNEDKDMVDRIFLSMTKAELEEKRRLLAGLAVAELSQCTSRFTRLFQEVRSKKDEHESICIANARSFEIQACTEAIPVLLQIARDLKDDAYRVRVAFVFPTYDSLDEARIRIEESIADQPMRDELEIHTWAATEQIKPFIRMNNEYEYRHNRAITFTLEPTDQNYFDDLNQFGLNRQTSLHPFITMSLQADQATIHIVGTQFRDAVFQSLDIHLNDLNSKFVGQVVGSFLSSFTPDDETCAQVQESP